MKTKIFYFSSTGNSLYVAQSIAKHLKNVNLVSIPDAIGQISKVESRKVGFVFPVYAYGLPGIVEDFISKIKLVKAEYVFAVATCGGTPGETLIQLKKLLRKNGSILNAGFVVKQDVYTFLEENAFMKFMVNLAGDQPGYLNDRLQLIVETIENDKHHQLETSKRIANYLGRMVHKIAVKQFKHAGKDFWVNEKCSTCKTCVGICPRKNIKIIDDKPKWHENCESCFACLQWCPKQAVEYKEASLGKRRSHNNKITLNDMTRVN